MTRIALIHATTVSMAPIKDSFARLWPEALTQDLLDGSLSTDQAEASKLTPQMRQRFQRLADYARFCGADGILYTCSAFGPAIEAVQQKVLVPVLKPNEAMFREAISRGGKIVLLVTFEPSVAPLRAEFDALSEGRNIALQTVLVEKAMAALASGDAATHNRLIAEAAQKTDGAETIVLAQFSMAQARPAVEAVTSVPVLTAPDSAVLAMRPHFDQSD